MIKYDWSNKKAFITDWEKAENICQFLLNAKMTATSGNYATFKKWYAVHLENQDNQVKENQINHEIFVENSVFNRRFINKLILKEKIIPYECKCGNKGVWNNQKLTLQLEHKNGVNNDNRIENLEYLCPNCHSQTPTYMGANVHLKVFEKRLPALKKYKIVSMDNVEEISEEWNVSKITALLWIRLYSSKLLDNKVLLCEKILKLEKNQTKKIKNSVFLSNRHTIISRKNDIANLKEFNTDVISMLAKKWSIKKEQVKSWVRAKNVEVPESFKEVFLIKTFEKRACVNSLNDLENESRIQSLLSLTNKKEVPQLANQWGMSTNGAKKWIKNHHHDKFLEIYDDKLLEKNKTKALKTIQMNYIKNLTFDQFNMSEFIKDYGGNKAGAHCLLSKYNPALFKQVVKNPVCSCGGESRGSGTYKGIAVYRCKSCNKSVSVLPATAN